MRQGAEQGTETVAPRSAQNAGPSRMARRGRARAVLRAAGRADQTTGRAAAAAQREASPWGRFADCDDGFKSVKATPIWRWPS